MKNYIIQTFLFLICVSAVCKEYKPSYGICTKVSQYPIVHQAGYTYIEPNVADFLAPDKSDSVFMVNLAEQKRLNAKIIS